MHLPGHREFGFPAYGSPGFGSAVGQALRSQAPLGLLEPGPYPEPPGVPPMKSGVSPRQSGFTGSVEWDVMNGNLEDPLGGPDMGKDPSDVGDGVGSILNTAGQYVGNISKRSELQPWIDLQPDNLGFPDRRKRRQTWMRSA